VIYETFGLNQGTGALRVVADNQVVVNSRIYNLVDGVTFGQGFEGVPSGSATMAGSSTDVIGLAYNTSFRTNIVLMDAAGTGSSVNLTLVDETGTQIAATTYNLDAYEPMLKSVQTVFSGVANFDNATLQAEVTSGSVIVVGSKVDNDADTGDPTTLASWISSCGSLDGTYQIALYDSWEYATAGYLEVDGGMVTNAKGTYMNWDKGGDPENPDCILIFPWGGAYLDIYDVSAFASGVSFTQSYSGGGSMAYTLTFDLTENQNITGTIDAVGSGFTGEDTGCNGNFPTQTLRGGKEN
jgi:hypothetical protein